MKLDRKIVYFFSTLVCFLFSSFADGKTVLVTGGAGFIGGTVTESLLKRGDTVIVVDCFISMGHDRIEKYNQMKRERLSLLQEQYKNQLFIYECSIENMSECEQIFQRHSVDVICHLAAHAGVRSSIQNPQKFIKTNIEGTVNVLELAVKYGVKHCVLASSSSVYGNCEIIPFSEEQPTDKQTSVYGATKKSLELIAQVYNSLYGISTTCLRFFTVYGPYGRFDMSPFIFMDAIYNKKPITVFGDGTVVRDFTYIDDIVGGVIKALDTPLNFQIFNLGSTHTIVLNDFITLIEKIVGKKAIIQYKDFVKADVRQTQASVAKAYELLGYEPKVLLKDGLQKMFDWYLKTVMKD